VPTLAELGEALEMSVETIVEAMEAFRSYQPRRLDEPRSGQDGIGIGTLAESLGERDPSVEAVPERASLDAAIDMLDGRSQLVIRRRYFQSRTQLQVAGELDVSQMQVSRLERGAIGKLREILTEAGL
jgi:RNA polymerase sigma-B factor